MSVCVCASPPPPPILIVGRIPAVCGLTFDPLAETAVRTSSPSNNSNSHIRSPSSRPIPPRTGVGPSNFQPFDGRHHAAAGPVHESTPTRTGTRFSRASVALRPPRRRPSVRSVRAAATMLVAMTAMLVSVAEFSNILSVLAVLICFCAMFLLIMR